MESVVSTLSTLAIFFAPGLLLVGAFGGGARRIDLSLGEQAYLVLAGSVLASGWVGLVLAELGWFSPALTATAVGGLVLGVAVGLRRSISYRPGRLGIDEMIVAICLVGFALAVYYPPYEYILGGKDPGVYVNTGFHLARHGNIAFVDPLVRDIPVQADALFFRTDKELPPWSQPRFLGYYMDSPETARVLPQGLHLYPVWIGIAAGLYQMKAGLYATPFFAMLGVAGFFLAARRILGTDVALWASGFLALFQIQVWFARFPNAEVLLQFLYATGLLGFYFMEEKRSSLAGLLSGAAFGSTLLVRLDSVLFFLPLGLYMGWKRLRRELGRPEAAFLASFLALAAHSAVHARLFSWPYISNVFGRWYWRWVSENILVIAAAALALFLIVDRLARRLAVRAISVVGSSRTRAFSAAAIGLLAFYAYFVRPFWHGARTAPHDAEAFFRMGWYLYPAGLALAVAGAMILVYRLERKQVLFVLTGVGFSLFFFYKIRVSNDHFFCMRRFIPVILPGLFAAMAVFLVDVRKAGGRLGGWASSLIGAALLLVYLFDGRPLWQHREFRGSLRFVEELARHIGDRDVVIFPRREGLHLLELPLAELEGRNVLEFYTLSPDRKLLGELMEAWRDRYGDIYFVTNYKISMSGFFTRHVRDFWFASEKYEYTYTRRPERSEPFHLRFTLSKAVDLTELARRMPKLRFVDVGGSDDPLVAWFHEKELEDGVSFRWSQKTSSVFLPGMSPDCRELVMRMAGPREALAPRARVQVSVNEQPLALLSPGADFETFRIALPRDLTKRLQEEPAILRLDATTWRPANWIPGATDIRDLGVRVDWIEVH